LPTNGEIKYKTAPLLNDDKDEQVHEGVWGSEGIPTAGVDEESW
jgi:hypothetical protein